MQIYGPTMSKKEMRARPAQITDALRALRGSERDLASLEVELDDLIEGEEGDVDSTTWLWSGATSDALVHVEAFVERAKGDARAALEEFVADLGPGTSDVRDLGLGVDGAELVMRGDYEYRGRKVLGFVELAAPERNVMWAFRAHGVDVYVVLRGITASTPDAVIEAAERLVAQMRVAKG